MARAKTTKRDRRDGTRLPKRIAGVKVPKALRKGSAMRRLAANPVVRDIVATALTAAAAAITSTSGKGGKAGGSSKAVGSAAIVAAFAAAATDVVRQVREGRAARADDGPDPTPHRKSAEPPVTH